MAVAAGGLYLVGSKTGREQFEKVRAWLSGRIDETLAGHTEALREETAGAVVETGAAMERAADRLGETLKEKAEVAGDLAREAVKKTGETVALGTARAGRKIVSGYPTPNGELGEAS